MGVVFVPSASYETTLHVFVEQDYERVRPHAAGGKTGGSVTTQQWDIVVAEMARQPF